MSFSKPMKLPILFSILLSLAACAPPLSVRSLTLDRSSAAPGETVQAILTGLPATDAIVTVAGLAATASANGANGLRITVPDRAEAGPQTVVVSAGGIIVEAALTILGPDTVPGLAAVIVAPTVSEGVFAGRIADLGFDLAGPQRSLGGSAGACAGRLATIDVGGTPLGEARRY